MPSTKPAPGGTTTPPPTLKQRALTAVFGDVSGMGIRHTLLQFLSLGKRERKAISAARFLASRFVSHAPSPPSFAGLIVTSALMIWKFLILWTGSESPVRERGGERRGERASRASPMQFFFSLSTALSIFIFMFRSSSSSPAPWSPPSTEGTSSS